VIRVAAAHRAADGQPIGGAVKAMADAVTSAFANSSQEVPARSAVDVRVNDDILLALRSLDAEVD